MTITTRYCDFCGHIIDVPITIEIDFNYIENETYTCFRSKDICPKCKEEIIEFLKSKKVLFKERKI
jgi:hypothetical protein